MSIERAEGADLTAPRRDIGRALRRWARAGEPIGVVRVLERQGFGTVEPGSLLVGAADERAGSVLGDTLDAVAVSLLGAALTGTAGSAFGQVAEPTALAAGLACAGGATLVGHPLTAAAADALGAALDDGVPAALATRADGTGVLVAVGPDLGSVHGGTGSPALDDAVLDAARGAVRRGATSTERVADAALDVWVPPTTVLLVGGGAIGDAVAEQARLLGWAVRTETAVDAALAAVRAFTTSDVLVLLDHGAQFDVLLIELLRARRGFAGALGSRRTQAARRDRLAAAGLDDAELAALRGPVGLDLGAATPAESAVSIVAEVIAVRSGRVAGSLGAVGGPING